MMQRLWMIAVLLCTSGYSGCPETGRLLQVYGFSEIKPPSELLAPGSLVALNTREPFDASIICTAESSLGANYRTLKSRTISGTLKKLNNRTMQLDATALQMIKENHRYAAIETVEITLRNASIVEVTDEHVLEGLERRTDRCSEAVARRIEGGYTVTMISSALMADASYNIKWEQTAEHSLSEQDKVGIAYDLSSALGGKMQRVTSASIEATGLIWGIKDDAYLSALSVPHIDERDVPRGTRYVEPERAVIVAPCVTPEVP